MTKHRNRYLGDAEIPRSVQQFFTENAATSIKLLINYIEELETQNKLLHERNQKLDKTLGVLVERVQVLETVVERLKGLRVLKPLTPEEREAKDAEKAKRLENAPWKNPRGMGAGKGAGKNKGWYPDVRPKKP